MKMKKMRTFISLMILAAMLVSLLPVNTAKASTCGWYEVNATPKKYAYLYSNASDRDEISKNMGRYDNGSLVYVIDYYAGKDGKYNYCYVETYDKQYGYMHDYVLSFIAYDDDYNPGYQKPNGSGSTGGNGSYGSFSSLPLLQFQCRGSVRGGDTVVYTGPSTNYYRTASGKAYVGGGESVEVYGKEGNWYLIRYYGSSNGNTITRCSFIPSSKLNPNGYVEQLNLSYTPIRIASNAKMVDAPDRNHGYNTINIDRNNAYALARYIDDYGDTWIYFESSGSSNAGTNNGHMSVRGFVLAKSVSFR